MKLRCQHSLKLRHLLTVRPRLLLIASDMEAAVSLESEAAESAVADAAAAEAAAHEVCASWGGDLAVRTGHGIVECSIHHATKADGLEEIQKRVTPDATLFAGDDTTDEDGFGILRPSDVAIRVGGGETIAPYGLADASAVAEALWFIHSRRSSATAGS